MTQKKMGKVRPILRLFTQNERPHDEASLRYARLFPMKKQRRHVVNTHAKHIFIFGMDADHMGCPSLGCLI